MYADANLAMAASQAWGWSSNILQASKDPLAQKLYPSMGGYSGQQLDLSAGNQLLFDQLHGSEPMAVDKLQEGCCSACRCERG